MNGTLARTIFTVGPGWVRREPRSLISRGVVVPLDMDPNEAPDTWFTDVDADGMNDLFLPTDAGHNLLPVAINEAGQ